MNLTKYKPLQTLGNVKPDLTGGLCKWWYTPIQNILLWPAIDPLTQQLTEDPHLKPGTQWFGPVDVPDKQLGWKQTPVKSKPGLSYKQEVTGYIPGLTDDTHFNLHNHAPHQFCVVGKLRSSGMLIILGNDLAGLDLNYEETSGEGQFDTPGSKISFTGDSVFPALIIPGTVSIFNPVTGLFNNIFDDIFN